MKFKYLLLSLGLLFAIPAFAANNPSDVLVKASIVEVQAMGAAAAQYPDIQTIYGRR